MVVQSKERVHVPSRRNKRVITVGDIDDVAVVVEAAFNQKVGIDRGAHLDGSAVGGVRQCAGDGVVAVPVPAQFRTARGLGHGVVHVVAQDLDLVIDFVVDADNIIANVDRCLRLRNDLVVGTAGARLGQDARVEVKNRIAVEELMRNPAPAFPLASFAEGSNCPGVRP